jgi:class 3 adenylate cyclase
MAFHEQQLVMVVTDLARFTRAVSGMNALEIAGLLDRVYEHTVPILTDAGGRIVKYMGDGYFAVAPPDTAGAIVAAVVACDAVVKQIASDRGLDLEFGANIHLSSVAAGEFSDGTYDVIGVGSIHAFRMGAGPGIRMSESVYRKLSSADRSVWNKHQAPATYTLAAQ